MIITLDTALAELRALGITSIDPPRDARFFCPSTAWLTEFGLWLKDQNRATPWIAEKFDCDDFAIRAIDRATESLCRNSHINDCGHSFCYAEIELSGNVLGIDGPGSHAVNFVRCSDTLAWHYFEPQMGTHLPLRDLLDDGRVFRVYDVWL